MNKTIGIIGFGNMGSAFYNGIKRTFPDCTITVFDSDPDKIFECAAQEKARSIAELVNTSSYIVIAVKPQSFVKMAQTIPRMKDEPVFISIMAGISLKNLEESLKTKKVVRSMPNLPITIKEGVIGWIATDTVNNKEKEDIKDIFRALGTQIELAMESDIDIITALSGSGPAYFFYVAECLQEQAEDWGFESTMAKKIARQTLFGSAKLLNESKDSPKKWRKRVTSRGGTTKAALTFLQENKWDAVFKNALKKAQNRSEELNT